MAFPWRLSLQFPHFKRSVHLIAVASKQAVWRIEIVAICSNAQQGACVARTCRYRNRACKYVTTHDIAKQTTNLPSVRATTIDHVNLVMGTWPRSGPPQPESNWSSVSRKWQSGGQLPLQRMDIAADNSGTKWKYQNPRQLHNLQRARCMLNALRMRCASRDVWGRPTVGQLEKASKANKSRGVSYVVACSLQAPFFRHSSFYCCSIFLIICPLSFLL